MSSENGVSAGAVPDEMETEVAPRPVASLTELRQRSEGVSNPEPGPSLPITESGDVEFHRAVSKALDRAMKLVDESTEAQRGYGVFGQRYLELRRLAAQMRLAIAEFELSKAREAAFPNVVHFPSAPR